LINEDQSTYQGARVAGLSPSSRTMVAFTLWEVFLFKSGLAESMTRAMPGTSWLLVLGGFRVVSWPARRVAHRNASKPSQYGAMAGFVLAETIRFVRLIFLNFLVAFRFNQCYRLGIHSCKGLGRCISTIDKNS